MRFEPDLHCLPATAAPGTSRVAAWRRERLIEAGFDDELATRLSVTSGIDLHAMLNLVDRGCPPELVVRILEPLSDNAGRVTG